MEDSSYFLLGILLSGMSLLGFFTIYLPQYDSWILLIPISISFVCGAYLLVTNFRSFIEKMEEPT